MSTHEKTFIDGRAAARILDVPSPRNVARLANDGLIGVRSIPHTREIYNRADVCKLARLNQIGTARAAV